MGVEEQMQAGNSTDLAPSSGTSTAQSEREEKKTASAEAPEQPDLFARAQRRRLPDERKSITHKFAVGGHEGYVIVGMYKGEHRRSSSRWPRKAPRFQDSWMVSHFRSRSVFKYGVPLKAFVDKLTNTRFEPSVSSSKPAPL